MKKTIPFCLYFMLSTLVSFATLKDDPQIEIIQTKQELSFFVSKTGQVNAKLKVSHLVESVSKEPVRFRRSVFFDNYSEVKKLKKSLGSKTQKIKPIISDHEADGIFHSDLKVCMFDHELKAKGDKAAFSYEVLFKDTKYLNALYFNDVYPVEQSVVLITIPDWLELDLREINCQDGSPRKSVEQQKKEKTITYEMDNLDSFVEFKNTPRRSKVDPHLIPIIASTHIKGKTTPYFNDVNDLYQWYAQLVSNIGNDNNKLTALVNELTTGKSNDLEKIKSIYYWVQDNIRYIAFEDGIMGFQPENCQTVLNNKYGDCKGMANLTKEMLLLAGYDARLTWLGTRDLPYTYDIPSLMVDNHMICTVILDGEKIYLDPTEKWSDIYNYALRIQGKEVLIEDGENYIVEKIPELPMEHSQEIINLKMSIDGDQIIGEGATKFTGNKKSSMYYYLSETPKNKKEQFFQNYISNRDKNINIKINEMPTLADRSKNISLEYELALDNRITTIGSELYVNLELDYAFMNYDMDKDRNRAFEFSKKSSIVGKTTFDLGKSYSVNYLPTPVNIETPDYIFQLAYTVNNNTLTYSKKIEIKNELLLPTQFAAWNKAIGQLKEFYADQIILDKQ
ncbi:MAG: transglutaminase domain-containing protein [Bacteroidota bacterium]